ncbi:MAG TPA: YihY/virulence factor BrkB family protein [Methylomirabilota bacterium]|jgi:membrane protein|nr:YihY/virulence factor BrkB family protein [Methylomirabilota bacterium]
MGRRKIRHPAELVRGVTRPSPWQLGGLSVRQLAARVYDQVWRDEVMDRAAALSYYFVVALFPALLFLTALFGLLPVPGLMDRLLGYTHDVLPGDAASLVRRTTAEAVRGARGGLLSLGAVGALWAASSGMNSAIVALNVVYDTKDQRPWWRRRLVALGLTVVFSLFVMLVLVLVVFGRPLGNALADVLGLGREFATAWTLLSWPVVVLIGLLGIGMVYYLAPVVRQEWRWVTPGSAFAVAVWLLVSFGLRLYVNVVASYNAMYGSIGGVILLLLWLYLSSLVILTGAEINSEIEKAAATRVAAARREPPAVTRRAG